MSLYVHNTALIITTNDPRTQLREAAVADFKLDHRAWAMQRERGPQLRAAIEHAWALFRAGSPNDYV